jgi:transmembrane sensor
MDDADPWDGLNASLAEMEAATWCERRSEPGWSESDQIELDTWLALSSENAVAFLRMSQVWDRADRLTALRQPLKPSIDVLTGQGRRLAPRWIAAAMVAVGMAGAAASFYVARPADETFSTPIGGREVLTLADGSQVELNTDTALRIRMTNTERTVFLQRGEAYFQVKHDSVHPFTVVAQGHRITDLGTKFSVREDGERLKVVLLEGSARIDAASKGKHSAILAPGDVALATADSLSVARRPVDRLANELGWRRGVLIFNHTTLEEAAREVNRYSRKKLVIADAGAARLMIGGTFGASNVDSIAEAAKEFFGLKVEDRGDRLVISK